MTMRMTWAMVGWLALPACGGSTDLTESGGTGAGHGGTAGTSPGGTGGTAIGGGGTGGAACYSPFENVNRAYDHTLPGCSCNTSSSICIQGVALICQSNQWQAVEDGPCMPTPDGLDCQGELTSPAKCLELFQTCVDLGNGRYCGLGRTSTLCPNGILVSAGGCFIDSSCSQVADGLWCTGYA
jgi:hypothetical protein